MAGEAQGAWNQAGWPRLHGGPGSRIHGELPLGSRLWALEHQLVALAEPLNQLPHPWLSVHPPVPAVFQEDDAQRPPVCVCVVCVCVQEEEEEQRKDEGDVTGSVTLSQGFGAPQMLTHT